MKRGDLDYDDNNVYWKGKKVKKLFKIKNKMQEGAKNLPGKKKKLMPNPKKKEKKFKDTQ